MAEARYPFVHLDVSEEDVDTMSSLLFDLGAEGVEERDATTLAKNASAGRVTLVGAFSTREEAEEAIRALPPETSARYEEVVGDAWRDAWKEHYKPYELARGLVVRPPWEPYAAKDHERVLELEPGRAFGTGLHETTRLVAGALAAHASELADETVLDVGCGSGILGLAALALGAGKAVCIDVDPEAVDVTIENAARNDLSSRVAASTTDLTDISGEFPVVVANIEARVLVPMAQDLSRRVKKGGLLFLSGILVTQKDEVAAAYTDLELLDAPSAGEWVLLAYRRNV